MSLLHQIAQHGAPAKGPAAAPLSPQPLHSRRRRCRPGPPRSTKAAAAPEAATTTTALDKPAWTGDSLLSRAVNGAIANPVLFGAMRVLAKAAMRRSARERGVDWAAHAAAVERREREVLMPLARAMAQESGLGMGPYEDEEGDQDQASSSSSSSSSSSYPDYYLVPFHSYERGNLEWTAAREVEPASLAIAMRTFEKDYSSMMTDVEGANAQEEAAADFAERAMARMRGQITGAVRDYVVNRHGLPPPRRILDAGCSTGISTRWLGWEFEKDGGAGGRALDALVGLDLSAYFLAVAEDEERRRRGEANDDDGGNETLLLGPRCAPLTLTRPRYVHGLAERAPFPDASFDLVAFNFVAHECPGRAIDAFCAEAKRLLTPGKGVLYFSDNDPQSATIQNLPAPIFTLMKSTEPWSDEYYAFSLEGALERAGFTDVVKVASDHRHRVVMGRAPAA